MRNPHTFALVVLSFAVLANRSAAQHDRPFAAIDSSLAQAADTLLQSSTTSRMDSTANRQAPEPASPRNFREKASAATARFDRLRPIVNPILEQEGIPAELAAVILVESGGNTAALSPKGARGLWQLMPDTARRYGLTVDAIRDDRLGVIPSTRAAARYLRDLHMQFGSWPLALAAYNTGEQHVQRAIGRTHVAEFGALSSLGLFPLETRNYVPAVLAAMHSSASLAERSASPVETTVFAVSAQ